MWCYLLALSFERKSRRSGRIQSGPRRLETLEMLTFQRGNEAVEHDKSWKITRDPQLSGDCNFPEMAEIWRHDPKTCENEKSNTAQQAEKKPLTHDFLVKSWHLSVASSAVSFQNLRTSSQIFRSDRFFISWWPGSETGWPWIARLIRTVSVPSKSKKVRIPPHQILNLNL